MIGDNYDLLNQAIAAFAGAFFAFLFVRLGEFFTKLYSREVKHYNSLVNLETQLNEIGGIIHDNLYILPFFQNVISSGNVYYNNLHVIPVDKSHYENLYDIELINELFTYFYQVRKINDDMTSATSGYGDIKNALIQGHITQEHYKVNAMMLAENLKMIEVFLSDLEERNMKLMARVRVQSKKDIPLGSRIMGKLIKTSGKNLKHSEINKELKKLEKEIEDTKTQSQKEIEEVIKKYRKKQENSSS